MTSGNIKRKYENISVIFSSLQVPVNGPMSSEAIRSERDAWVKAINKLCIDWKHKCQSENVYEELTESAAIARPIKECQSESETEPESAMVQNNHGSALVPPLPRPRISAAPVPLLGPELEPAYLPALGPEKLRLPSTPMKTPVPGPVTHLPDITSLIPAPPMPPPLPMKATQNPVTKKTKAFHWDVIIQDKVLYLLYCAKCIEYITDFVMLTAFQK